VITVQEECPATIGGVMRQISVTSRERGVSPLREDRQDGRLA